MNRNLSISDYIKIYKNDDSDYWTSGNGNNDLLTILLNYTPNSWTNIQTDLINWDSHELEIFANALSDEEGWHYSENINLILGERSSLFTYIFTIIDSNIAFDLFDKIDFIFKGEKKPKDVLEKVKIQFEKIKRHESLNLFYTQEKIYSFEKILDEEINASR